MAYHGLHKPPPAEVALPFSITMGTKIRVGERKSRDVDGDEHQPVANDENRARRRRKKVPRNLTFGDRLSVRRKEAMQNKN